MNPKWWERTVFYQVYPRSFADGNGDGIGDISGIIAKLDYLQWLGIGAVWLSPHYPSPQVDVGYDIADYTAVEPEYGTLDDFDRLLGAMHARGMKLIIDLVLNHTSHQHEWFRQSRSDRDNPKRDWYVWRDGTGDAPPNNWQSEFGGSAWEYDNATGQWYYHYFLKEQPDLNWRNPEVKAAMFDAARFWLDKGVDGFRLDAISTIFEDEDFTSHASRYNAVDALRSNWLHDIDGSDVHYELILADLFKYQRNHAENFKLMEELRALVDSYDDRFLIGETSDLRFLGEGDNRLHSIFNFDLLYQKDITPEIVRDILRNWGGKAPKGSRIGNTLNNHDQSRMAEHFAPDDPRRCRSAIATTLFLEGIPFLYYGEEIGMRDYAIRSLDEMRDHVGYVYRRLRQEDGIGEDRILQELGKFSRDRCRTPMQWNRSPNAGFSPGGIRTWLPVNGNYVKGVNVADENADPDSLLHFYRNLICLRNANAALQTGTFYDLDPSNGALLVFLRESPEQTCLVAVNFTDAAASFTSYYRGRILYGGGPRGQNMEKGACEIPPFGLLVAELLHKD